MASRRSVGPPWVTIGVLLVLVLTGCGDGDVQIGQAESGGVETAADSATDQANDGDGTTNGDGDGDVGPATTAGSEDGAAGTDTTAGSSDSGGGSDGGSSGGAIVAPYRPAAFDPPPKPLAGAHLAFNADGAYRIDGNGATKLIDGPISELSRDGAGGILFQRPGSEEVIWWLADGETAPVDLLVTVAPIHLVLEGVTGSGNDRRIVYQRVARTGVPDTSIDELKTYRFDDAEVTTLDVVGGWEAGTTISAVTGEVASGIWGGEGYNAYYVFDLAGGTRLGSFPEEQWGDFLSVEAAFHGADLIAVGLLYEEERAIFSEMGVYRVDLDGQVLETITSFPWDNGYWYPNGLFVEDGRAVISRTASPDRDLDEAPLGPLVVDLATGEPYTVPFAVIARPLS